MKSKLLFTIMIVTCLGFTACKTKHVTDVDGNVYKTITLGKQIWMAENLKTTKLNDGTPIVYQEYFKDWIKTKAPAYSWVYLDAKNKDKYGALYNWYTVNTKKLCPIGWHVPSHEEWTTLTEFLSKNGYGYKGDELSIGKSLASQSDWLVNSGEGNVGNKPEDNNKSGFSAIPSGFRGLFDGSFSSIGESSFWWSSTIDGKNAWIRILSYMADGLNPELWEFGNGLSVRCVKDK